jgi:hypothetical protein
LPPLLELPEPPEEPEPPDLPEPPEVPEPPDLPELEDRPIPRSSASLGIGLGHPGLAAGARLAALTRDVTLLLVVHASEPATA